MSDPSLIAQVLPSALGGLIGGSFALAGGALTAARAARHDRHRVEREDLVRLAAEMIRNGDAKWVADIDYMRAVYTLSNAEQSKSHSTETMQVFRDQQAGALRSYSQANDTMRSLVAEMRLRQPDIASEAEALWRESGVQNRGGSAGSMNPSDHDRRTAESAFIDKVRARVNELK